MSNIISNFSNSLYNHVQSGFKQVDEETKNNRLKICKDCEFYEDSLIRCNKCGCFLLIKAAWASEDCPLQKWDKNIIEQEQQQIPSEVKKMMSTEHHAEDCGCNKK